MHILARPQRCQGVPKAPCISLPLTPEQVSFLDSQADQFKSRQDVVRGLIDSQMRALAGVATLESETDRASFRSPSLSSKSSSHSSKEECVYTVPSEEKIAPSGASHAPKKKKGETGGKKNDAPSDCKVKRPQYTPEFEEFWAEYQKLPKKVHQTKYKAFEVFKQVIDFESPKNLIRAAKLYVNQQVADLDGIDAWTMSAPDCFRWLKDDRYSVLLENHRAAQPRVQMRNGHLHLDATPVAAEF